MKPVDVLINSAGIAHTDGFLQTGQEVFEVNKLFKKQTLLSMTIIIIIIIIIVHSLVHNED